jgi:hypothetical protein
MQAILAILATFALVTLLLGWSRWLAGRRWAAAGHWLLAAIVGGATAWGWPVANHVATYEPRVGQAIAELLVEQTGARRFRVTLTRLPSGRMQVFELAGTEWRVDVRTLDWKGRAADLGWAPLYRLEQLSSRETAAAERATTTYDLRRERGRDIWPRAGSDPLWVRLVQAGSAGAAWQPLANDARFELTLTEAGIEVKPLNTPASESLAARG